MLFKLMPALLKCDLVPIVPNAILHVYLTVHLTVHLAVDFGLDFGVPPFADLPVYRCFLSSGVGRDPFLDQFWHMVLPVFLGTLELDYALRRT